MASRAARRNRGRAMTKAAPFRQSPGGITYSPEQVTAMLAAQQQLAGGNMRAQPLPSSPYWDTSPFGPGQRLPPAAINVVRPDTQRAEPRLWEFPVSWNLQIDDRWHVPWKTLQAAADMPLFRKCIKRRKGICSLGYAVTLDPKAVAREAATSGEADKDVEKAMQARYMPEIGRCSDWMENPDGPNGYDWVKWTGLVMENMLKYDAVAVYPHYTLGGQLDGLEVIDGKLIKPLLNERGGRPRPPYPAYQQILYGFPRGEFTADYDPDTGGIPGGYSADVLVYERREVRSESPYGMSDTEIALFDGLLWMRRMGWMMAEYTEGVMPTGLLETGEETQWTPRQWEDWQRALNDHLSGNTAERHKWPLMPPGVRFVQGEEIAERYKPDYDMFLIKLLAGDFGLTATELGFPEVGSLGASFHEGEEDVINRVTRKPDAEWLGGLATKLARRFLGMPAALRVEILGLESEDEAAADAVAQNQVSSARLTLNEDRERRGLPRFDFDEANMPIYMTGRGIVFVENASKQVAPGELVTPAQAPPMGAPQGQEGGNGEAGSGGDDAKDGSSGSGGSGRAVPSKAGQGAAKSAELQALRRWLSRHGSPARPFACKELTAADVPELAADPRVLLKDSPPKVPAGTGPAGRGTFS